MYTNNYTKEREYKEYNSVLSIRLNKDFYTFLHKINPINISSTIRSLIRSDLYEGEIETYAYMRVKKEKSSVDLITILTIT